jgi:ATP-dependent protease ClpP protease subunit
MFVGETGTTYTVRLTASDRFLWLDGEDAIGFGCIDRVDDHICDFLALKER